MSALSYEYKETILKVRDVSLTLGGNLILNNLNADIRNIVRPGVTQGQIVGLLGPSGVGKTRLFRILAGLDAPDTGSVLVEEEGKPVERGMVGVVAQHYPLFAHRTIEGNLVVAGKQANLSGAEAKRKAADLLQRFGIAEHARKYPVQLSGGQRQRVAIAQQFMCSDHFLLMDEPFSGLDLIALERVSNFIREIALTDELKTLVIVTHDVTAALAVCDTVWLLGRDRDKQGAIIPGARIQAVYDLAERGLAWQKNAVDSAEYITVLREIRERFTLL